MNRVRRLLQRAAALGIDWWSTAVFAGIVASFMLRDRWVAAFAILLLWVATSLATIASRMPRRSDPPNTIVFTHHCTGGKP